MKQPTSFLVQCEAGLPFHFRVAIYGTRKQMLQALKNLDGVWVDKATQSCCVNYKLTDDGKVTPELGTIFFYEGNLAPSALAHEFVHASVVFCRKRRIQGMRRSKDRYWDGEERHATAVGWMMHQFYVKQPQLCFQTHGAETWSRHV